MSIMSSVRTKQSALNIDIGNTTTRLLFREEVEYIFERLLNKKDNKNLFKNGLPREQQLSLTKNDVRFSINTKKLGNHIEPHLDYITEFYIDVVMRQDEENIDREQTCKDMENLAEPFMKNYIIRYPPQKVYKLYDKLNYVLLYDDFAINMYLTKSSLGTSFVMYYFPFTEKFDLNHMSLSDRTGIWREGHMSDDDIRYTIAIILAHQQKQDFSSSPTRIHNLKADNFQTILESLLKNGISFDKLVSDINKVVKEYLEKVPTGKSTSRSRRSRK